MKAITPWYVGKKLTQSEYTYSKLSWEDRQSEIDELKSRISKLESDNVRLHRELIIIKRRLFQSKL